MTDARPPGLTVVIPAHDAATTLGGQLDALLAQHWDDTWEVLVVDHRSTDGTRALVERYATRDPRVRLATAGSPARVGHSRNVGIASARSDAIAMCDADDVVGRGWVRAMGDGLREHELVTGPLEIDRLNPAWVVETRGRAIERGPGDFLGVFPFAHSCNIGFRRSVVRRCGGFDERLPAGEDIEWSFRAWRAGVRVTYLDTAEVHYRYRQGLGDLWRQARAYGQVGAVLARRFRRDGVELPRRSGARSWLWLVRRMGLLRHRPGRARWIWVAGGRVGALEGTVHAPVDGPGLTWTSVWSSRRVTPRAVARGSCSLARAFAPSR